MGQRHSHYDHGPFRPARFAQSRMASGRGRMIAVPLERLKSGVLKSLVLGLFLVASALPAAQAQERAPVEGPNANPGRPTVSTPATLTPVGYVQFETGYLGAWHSPGLGSQSSVNEVVKFSVAPRLEFL